MIMLYRELLSTIRTNESGAYDIPVNPITANDEVFSAHLCLCLKYIQLKAQAYHCGRDFLLAIHRIDREIPIEILPEEFCAYFSFPQRTVYDEEDEIQGAYIYVGPDYRTPLRRELCTPNSKQIWISYVTTSGSRFGHGLFPITDESISQMIQRLPEKNIRINEDGELYKTFEAAIKPQRNDVYRLVINLAIYIHSTNPDAILTPPARKMKPAQRKQVQKSGSPINQCTIPVTFVSYNYKSPKRFHIDSTWVETFLRWQRCGPNYAQVRLIWVKPHERKFKGEKP